MVEILDRGHSLGAFRASALQYALGRAGNALMAMAIFAWLAGTLSAREYAAYVVVIAALEILLVVGNLGLDWVAAIEIPRLQVAGAPHALSRLVSHSLGILLLAFSMLAGLLAFAAEPLAAAIGLPGAAPLLHWYAVVLLVEGVSRAVRDQVLSGLLMQWAAQLAQTLRNAAVLIWLAALYFQQGGLAVQQVAQAELVGSGLSLVLGGGLLWHRLAAGRAASAADLPHPASALSALRRLALNAWVASLAGLLGGGQMVVLLVSRFLGAEAAGLLGFARNLVEQFRKLMPIEFLFNLVRTFLVARFAADQGAATLLARVALLVRGNLGILLPSVSLMVLFGAETCDWLSHGRYRQAHWLVVGWLAWVAVWSHHRLTDVLAHVLGRSGVIGKVSLVMAAMPLAYALALAGGHLLPVFAVLVAGELAYSVWVIRCTLQGDPPYPWARLQLPALLGACALATASGLLLQGLWPAAPLLLAALAVLVVYGLTIGLFKPWDGADRQLIFSKGA